jgi:dihydroorotase-like cyclic amidohydrolase
MTTTMKDRDDSDTSPTLVISNARLAYPDPARINDLWRIECSGGRVSSIRSLDGEDFGSVDIDAKGSLVLPS